MNNINSLIKRLEFADFFAFDTETAPGQTGNALDIHSLEIAGMSFCFSPGDAVYIPLPSDQNHCRSIMSRFGKVFNEPKTIIMHNAKFDMQVLLQYGITVTAFIADTMVAHYLLNPNSEHGLKKLSKQYLNVIQTELSEIIGFNEFQISVRDANIEEMSKYACADADMTLQLWNIFKPQLISRNMWSLYRYVESKLIPVLTFMEYNGVKLDSELLFNAQNDAETQLTEFYQKITSVAGYELNINSSSQLNELLFDDLRLTPIGKPGISGNHSVGKSAMKRLRSEHSIIEMILEYKSLSTIKSSFLKKLPTCIHPKTGLIHGKFNQNVTRTGRLSSKEPNLQNIPKQSKGIGSVVRKAFISRFLNGKIASSDYNQIEVRLLAHLSKDKNLIEAFKSNTDIHTMIAAKLFEVPESAIDKEGKERKISKAVIFGISYGMSDKGLANKLTEELGKEVSTTDASYFIESFFTRFPGVKRFQNDCIYQGSIKGYTETIFGRRRYIPDIDSYDLGKKSAATRIAMNTPVQGSAADIIKLSMVSLHNYLSGSKLQTKMIMQVHDELVFDIPQDELDIVLPEIKKKMEGVLSLAVPLEVEINVGENWMRGEKWNLTSI